MPPMGRLHRLIPFAYSALHSHHMLLEWLLTPLERRTAERDRARLQARFPALADYERDVAAHRRALQPAYDAYTRDVSPALVTISLELAAFLALACQVFRPRAILDLGSGFSSYVFRAYQKAAAAGVVVWSVDGSSDWLARTGSFLREHDLADGDLLTLDAFQQRDRPQFDLVLQDIADLATRQGLLGATLDACRPGALLVIDDMHVPGYRFALLRELKRRNLERYSLRSFTRKRLRYSYLVIP